MAAEYWIIPNILISVKPELVEQDSNPDCVAPAHEKNKMKQDGGNISDSHGQLLK